MDKALIGKSSSDPRCTFTVAGTAIKLQSSTKKSTLTPTWKETFEVPLPKGPPETKWQLVVDVEDWDRVSAADFIGRVTVELDSLADQAIVKGWYPLRAKDGGEAQGEVYLVLQWRRNAAMAFEPFEDETEYAAKEPNELRIAAVSALGLAVADKNLLSAGGSSQCISHGGVDTRLTSDPAHRFLRSVPHVCVGGLVAQTVQNEAQEEESGSRVARAVCAEHHAWQGIDEARVHVRGLG